MTLCNMSIELGARAGLVAPDDVTLEYLHGRPDAPTGSAGSNWTAAAEYWATLPTDPDAVFDTEVRLDADSVRPFVTWGTNPAQGVPIDAAVPDPDALPAGDEREAARRALDYMDLRPGQRMRDIALDAVFLGSCTNSRVDARTWVMLVAIGFMLTIWMFPSHKLFDHTLLLCGIWFATQLIEEPSSRRIFAGGLFIGLCVFFGKNHALYNFLAQGFLLFSLYFKLRPRFPLSRGAIWLTGLAIGLVPIIAMFLCIPGFAQSYVESIESILQRGTNLGLPVPWPWQTALTGDFASIQQFVLGILFVALPVFFTFTLCSCLFLRSHP